METNNGNGRSKTPLRSKTPTNTRTKSAASVPYSLISTPSGAGAGAASGAATPLQAATTVTVKRTAPTTHSLAKSEVDDYSNQNDSFVLGDIVYVSGDRNKRGKVRYVGNPPFSSGIWVGVELPNPVGRNDGSVQGKRYFTCKPNHGLFVRVGCCMKALPQSDSDSIGELPSNVTSRTLSAPNTANGKGNNAAHSSSNSNRSRAAQMAASYRQQNATKTSNNLSAAFAGVDQKADLMLEKLRTVIRDARKSSHGGGSTNSSVATGALSVTSSEGGHSRLLRSPSDALYGQSHISTYSLSHATSNISSISNNNSTTVASQQRQQLQNEQIYGYATAVDSESQSTVDITSPITTNTSVFANANTSVIDVVNSSTSKPTAASGNHTNVKSPISMFLEAASTPMPQPITISSTGTATSQRSSRPPSPQVYVPSTASHMASGYLNVGPMSQQSETELIERIKNAVLVQVEPLLQAASDRIAQLSDSQTNLATEVRTLAGQQDHTMSTLDNLGSAAQQALQSIEALSANVELSRRKDSAVIADQTEELTKLRHALQVVSELSLRARESVLREHQKHADQVKDLRSQIGVQLESS